MDYADYEAYRVSNIMVNDPHGAAAEMRGQLQQLDPATASELIRKTQQDQIPGSFGYLAIQPERDQNGVDTGFRNVSVLTPDGPDFVAELQAAPVVGGAFNSFPGAFNSPGDFNSQPGAFIPFPNFSNQGNLYNGDYNNGSTYNNFNAADPLAAIAAFVVNGIIRHDDGLQWGYQDQQQLFNRQQQCQDQFQNDPGVYINNYNNWQNNNPSSNPYIHQQQTELPPLPQGNNWQQVPGIEMAIMHQQAKLQQEQQQLQQRQQQLQGRQSLGTSSLGNTGTQHQLRGSTQSELPSNYTGTTGTTRPWIPTSTTNPLINPLTNPRTNHTTWTPQTTQGTIGERTGRSTLQTPGTPLQYQEQPTTLTPQQQRHQAQLLEQQREQALLQQQHRRQTTQSQIPVQTQFQPPTQTGQNQESQSQLQQQQRQAQLQEQQREQQQRQQTQLQEQQREQQQRQQAQQQEQQREQQQRQQAQLQEQQREQQQRQQQQAQAQAQEQQRQAQARQQAQLQEQQREQQQRQQQLAQAQAQEQQHQAQLQQQQQQRQQAQLQEQQRLAALQQQQKKA